MVFGLLLVDNNLYSISDDRTLQVWDLTTMERLDEAYGHATRPLTVCHGPQGSVITGGQVRFSYDCTDSYHDCHPKPLCEM